MTPLPQVSYEAGGNHRNDSITAAIDGDGCTAERSLPVVCVRVTSDGSYPALADTFAKCPSDPNL